MVKKKNFFPGEPINGKKKKRGRERGNNVVPPLVHLFASSLICNNDLSIGCDDRWRGADRRRPQCGLEALSNECNDTLLPILCMIYLLKARRDEKGKLLKRGNHEGSGRFDWFQ